MPLESGSTLAQLDIEWPLGEDPVSKGDDHIRLIKSVLKAQFPGEVGDGFDMPITANETELNYVEGVASPIQTQLDDLDAAITALASSLPAPTGTKMLFYQAAPPDGWTQDTGVSDVMLRVTDTVGGGAPAGDWVVSGLTTELGGIHSHNVVIPNDGWDQSGGFNNQGHLVTNTQNSFATSTNVDRTIASESGGEHSHGVTSDGTWRPAYVDVVVGVKDAP